MSKVFNYVAASVIVFLLILWYYQNRQTGPKLLPGEQHVSHYPVPVFASVTDLTCSDSIGCQPRMPIAVSQTFKVSKDTTYFLSVDYINEASVITGSACGTVMLGDSVVMHRVAGCQSEPKAADFGHLHPGKEYTLSVSLQRCADASVCPTGTKALAAVSLRKIN